MSHPLVVLICAFFMGSAVCATVALYDKATVSQNHFYIIPLIGMALLVYFIGQELVDAWFCNNCSGDEEDEEDE